MKLLTLNTHSLVGEDASARAEAFVAALAQEAPTVIALQEVNQSRTAPLLTTRPDGFIPCGASVPLRDGHYAVTVAEALRRNGLNYAWTWLPVKIGYDRYDEGLALFYRGAIAEVRTVTVSRSRAYESWKTRMALMMRPEGSSSWFCNLHMSWWNDPEEPFLVQWERLAEALPKNAVVWLMGDFNNPAERRGEGYDRLTCAGFYDSFLLAHRRFGEETIRDSADGWRGRAVGRDRFRIDQIWCNRRMAVSVYRTVFDGRDFPVVSDHYGVMIEVCGAP